MNSTQVMLMMYDLLCMVGCVISDDHVCMCFLETQIRRGMLRPPPPMHAVSVTEFLAAES